MNENREIENSETANKKPDIKLDSYRWVIVAIFAAYCGTNFFLFMQFTIIANITERYYNVNSFTADASGLVFMGSYIIFFIPVGHFIEKKNLKDTAIISTGLTAFGNFLKLFAISPDRFYLVLLSQAICGVGQVLMISMPPQVASTWFGGEEVSIACAIGVMGCQIGLALGCMVPTLLVPDSPDIREIADGFSTLFTVDNVASMSMFILVILYPGDEKISVFRPAPESPPSQAQANRQDICEEVSYVEAFKSLLKNKDYKLVLITFGLSYAVFNCLGIIVNEMFLHFFPNNGKMLGFLTLAAVISGGVFGTIFFGYILDRTHEFKKLTNIVLIMNAISWMFLIVAFHSRSLLATSLLIPIAGFFGGSLVVIGFEYATETTYPTPEVFSASLLNAVIYLFAIIDVLVIECAFKTIGFVGGQLIFLVIIIVATVFSFMLSSDYKRAGANLMKSVTSNYGSVFDSKLP